MMLDQELLAEVHRLLDYDRERGELRRKVGSPGIVAGSLVGPAGQCEFLGKRRQVSHLIWLIETGSLPKRNLIHVNGDKLDFRFRNLAYSPEKQDVYTLQCERHGSVLISRNRKRKRGLACPECGRERGVEKTRAKRKTTEEKRETMRLAGRRQRAQWTDEQKAHARVRYNRWHARNRDNPQVQAARKCHQMMVRTIRRVRDHSGKRPHGKLGYSPFEFKAHIEAQWEPWMNWDNHGDWHVDHIVPMAFFIRQGIHDPAIINALENLQPLDANLNRMKSDTIVDDPRVQRILSKYWITDDSKTETDHGRLSSTHDQLTMRFE